MTTSIPRTTPRVTRTLTAIVAAATLTLAGCAEPGQNTNSSGGGEKKGNVTTITLYTSEPEAKADLAIAEFEKLNPDVKVNMYRGGTGELVARIASEKSSGGIKGDVLWCADAPTFELYKQDGDLAELTNFDFSSIVPEAIDPDHTYVGTRMMPTIITYNTQKITEDNAPKSWAELTDPKYKGEIVLGDPAVSGATAFNAAVWMATPELGENWVNALGANRPMVAQSAGPVAEEVAAGGHPIGIVTDYRVRDLADEGSPIKAVYPTDGAPYITQPAAVFAASKQRDAAQRFVAYLVSKEGQTTASKLNYLPVRDDVDGPAGAPTLKDIPLLEADLNNITQQKKDAVSYFQKAMR
ncbi:ABC transporter substrate-binding protein [Corynebacterium aquatimens]|uniref:Iron(III) transport system substrate-binding protein n=1 Tax=Corynebacterium aquatimens TaxID=1190508 RepID=A0A931E1T3_9CORY|nr:ABC transporter substrate-binding protein [Corynebacterium aquatimens]MBG6121781.1 iron(III) transport system substrate-binding protein [Corynebacterium aquatimens]WJY65680.1 Iron-utilization periplasmic protein precursor [Corynebacterium aquatimens]